jgi:hypothetical protein
VTYIIIRRSERELRERAAETAHPGYRQGRNIDGYARDLDEADRLLASRGRDNPHQKPILVDEGSDRASREAAARAMGVRLEAYGDD